MKEGKMKTFIRRVLGAFAAAMLLLAQAPGADASRPPATYRFAYAHDDCAPWDGAALRIVLQREPVAPVPKAGPSPHGALPAPRYPHWSIALWQGDPPLNTWIALPGEASTGMGSGHIAHATGPQASTARKGRVRIEALTPAVVRGELRVELEDGTGREEIFPFTAPRLKFVALCG
jgi:hypothetical protein